MGQTYDWTAVMHVLPIHVCFSLEMNNWTLFANEHLVDQQMHVGHQMRCHID